MMYPSTGAVPPRPSAPPPATVPFVGTRGRADDKASEMIAVSLSLVLAAIAAVTAYYLLYHGFMTLDNADISLSRWDSFVGAVMVYGGGTFSIAAVGNLALGFYYLWDEENLPEKRSLKLQALGTIGIPVAVLPFLICQGIEHGMKGRWSLR